MTGRKFTRTPKREGRFVEGWKRCCDVMGMYSQVSFIFYRVVIQEFLLFGLDSWALLERIMRDMERHPMRFLRKITWKRAMCQVKRTWEIPAAEEVLRAAGNNSESDYIGRRQAMISQWLALHPFLGV